MQVSSNTPGREPPDLLAGVTIAQPLEVVPTIITNAAERITGTHDDRIGHASSQVLLAGVQLVQAGLRHAAQGSGAIATGSSILGKIIPTLSIGVGGWQMAQGWQDVEAHGGDVTDLIHSKQARTGALQTAAGALLFVPGVGTAIGGAGLRLLAAANELDAFRFLDWRTPARA